MNLEPTQEQNDLAATVRKFVEAELPLSGLHSGVSADARDTSWTRTADLGWIAIGVPESAGGVGLGVTDETFLFEELGRGLVAGPYLPTKLATHLAVVRGDEELVRRFVSGESRAGLAVAQGDDGVHLVVDGDAADHLLVWGPDSVTLVETPGDVVAMTSIDPGATIGQVQLSGSQPLLVADVETVSALQARAAVLAAAQLAGMLQATRDMSVEYGKTRTQFGSPIGSFQAVSRRCADMAVRAWAATSLARLAGLCIDAGRADGPFLAAAAKTTAGIGAARSTKDNIQNLGGIGFTDEHDAHLFFKRARIVDDVWGDSRRQAHLVNGSYQGIFGVGSHQGLTLTGAY